jgi:hypothetical protein
MENRNETAMRGNLSQTKREYLNFLDAWKSAGYPKHFKMDKRKGRIWDAAAMRENIDLRMNPELKRSRMVRGEMEHRSILQDMAYR